MGWTSYYVGSKSTKDCVMEEVAKSSSKIKKTVQKGSKFYFLMETQKGEDWVLLMLTSKKQGEFYYKDIQCNPYEHGIPSSILKEFKPSNERDKKWLEENLKILEEENAMKKSFKIGDVVKCRSYYDIEWGWYTKVKAHDDFYVMIESKNNAKRTSKVLRLLAKTKDTNGKEYLYPTMCRLKNTTFEKGLESRVVDNSLEVRKSNWF